MKYFVSVIVFLALFAITMTAPLKAVHPTAQWAVSPATSLPIRFRHAVNMPVRVTEARFETLNGQPGIRFSTESSDQLPVHAIQFSLYERASDNGLLGGHVWTLKSPVGNQFFLPLEIQGGINLNNCVFAVNSVKRVLTTVGDQIQMSIWEIQPTEVVPFINGEIIQVQDKLQVGYLLDGDNCAAGKKRVEESCKTQYLYIWKCKDPDTRYEYQCRAEAN